jgi:hypothetical protein
MRGVDVILAQHYLACLSHASYLIGDETTGRAGIVDPAATSASTWKRPPSGGCGPSG